ncbi:MAG: hypothetical protein RLW61_18360 [Gammaproteobacteria bacterium]
MIRSPAVVALTLSLVVAGACPADGSGPDIAGIQLGMTPDEARAKIQAYDDAIRIQDMSNQFRYSALGKKYKTDAFLVSTTGMLTNGRGSLAVGYSYPPGAPRVTSISRNHRQSVEPLTQADYVKALVEKYGTPAEDVANGGTGAGALRTLKWTLAGSGTNVCTEGVSAGNPVLKHMQQNGRRVEPTPELAATCAGVFKYVLRGDPVIHAVGDIADIAGQAKSEFAAQDWVQRQIDDKSRTGTAPPKL